MFGRVGRGAAAIGVAVGIALAASACSSGGGAGSGSGGTVVYAGFGGAVQDGQAKAWLEPFQKSTGITVKQDTPSDYTKVQQMVKSNFVTWDMIDGGQDFPGGTTGGNPSLTDIDCEVVACSDYTGQDKAEKQSVPSYVYAQVLAYNTDTFGKNPPKGAEDLWNTKEYPGKRGIYTSYGLLGLLEVAELHAGIPRDELYPIDVDAAFKELDKIKSDLVFYTDTTDGVNSLANGDTVMAFAFNADIQPAKDVDELPVDIAWGQQSQATASLLIPKNDPNEKNAQKLAAWITSPKHNGEISRYIPYSPANPKATAVGKYADAGPKAHELTGDDAPLTVDLTWWSKNAAAMYERVADWTSQ